MKTTDNHTKFRTKLILVALPPHLGASFFFARLQNSLLPETVQNQGSALPLRGVLKEAVLPAKHQLRLLHHTSFLHNFCSLNIALKLVSTERRPVLHHQHQVFRHLPFQRRLVSKVNIPCFLCLQRNLNDKPPTRCFFCAFKQS